jgi:hypothetical protein
MIPKRSKKASPTLLSNGFHERHYENSTTTQQELQLQNDRKNKN